MAYIARSLTALLERTPTDKAIVVFGARQTGKTTLLEHLFQDRKVKWLSGDEPQDRELLTSLSSKADISILLDVLVIDEAQRIQGIGMLLKRLEDSKPSCRIFATGSSSLELAGGVMESAAGRLWPMTLFPLSVSELADHNSWLDVMESLPIQLPGNRDSPAKIQGNFKVPLRKHRFQRLVCHRRHPPFRAVSASR